MQCFYSNSPLYLTVLFKCKSTVLTRNSILNPHKVSENQESIFKARVSIFEDRESSFEDRVSSFKTLEEFFEDLEQRFRRNDLILEEKTMAMNKGIDTPFECIQIFFRVVHFLQDTCGSLICTEADNSMTAN